MSKFSTLTPNQFSGMEKRAFTDTGNRPTAEQIGYLYKLGFELSRYTGNEDTMLMDFLMLTHEEIEALIEKHEEQLYTFYLQSSVKAA